MWYQFAWSFLDTFEMKAKLYFLMVWKVKWICICLQRGWLAKLSNPFVELYTFCICFTSRAKYHKLKYGTDLNQGDMKPPSYDSGKFAITSTCSSELLLLLCSHTFRDITVLPVKASLMSDLVCLHSFLLCHVLTNEMVHAGVNTANIISKLLFWNRMFSIDEPVHFNKLYICCLHPPLHIFYYHLPLLRSQESWSLFQVALDERRITPWNGHQPTTGHI